MDEQLDDVARRGRAARRAHRVGGVDLRALRLRHRHVHDPLGAARRSTPTPGASRRRSVRLVDGDAASRRPTRCTTRARRGAHRRDRRAAPEWWSPHLRTAGKPRRAFFTAVHDGRRRAAGHASPRYAARTSAGPTASPDMTLRVIEVQAVDADAEAALWSYLFGIDLVGDRAGGRPARRRPAALAPRRSPPAPRPRGPRSPVGARRRRRRRRSPARTYGADDGLVIELVDAFRPAQQRPVADRRWTRRRRVAPHRRIEADLALSRTRARCDVPRRRRAVRRSAAAGRVTSAIRRRRRAGPTASSSRTRHPGAPRTSEPAHAR